nr:PAS domain S-box protein [Simiduia aestuariiviva]
MRGSILVADGHDDFYPRLALYSNSRDVVEEFPGALGFGFIRRLAVPQVDDFLARVRAAGRPDFAIKELTPHTGERFVIEAIFPEARNRAAIGLDIASEGNRRAAAYEAMRSGEVQFTAPITLVQKTGAVVQAGLLLMPVYKSGATPDTEAQRLAECIGWSYAPLVLPDVLASLELNTVGTQLLLRDVHSESPLYGKKVPADLDKTQLSHELTRAVYGRQWQLTLQFENDYFLAQRGLSAVYVYGLGLVLSALAALVTYLQLANLARKRHLLDQQKSMAALMNDAPDAIVGLDPTGRVSSWNTRAQQMFGYRTEEILGRRLIDLLVPEAERGSEYAKLEALAKGEAIASFEARRRRSDGNWLDVQVAMAPVYDDQRRVVGISETLRDIGAEKRAMEQIERLNAKLEGQVQARTADLNVTQRQLQTVLDAVPAQVSFWDTQLRNQVANKAFLDVTHVSRESLHGRLLGEVDSSNLLQTHRAKFKAAMDGITQQFERQVQMPDGSRRFFLTHLVPDSNDEHAAGLFIMDHDITEITENRLQLAEALHENEVLLSTIDAQLQLSITDLDGTILEANDNFCRATGYQENELIGQDHKKLNSGVHNADFFAEMWQTINAGKPWRGEMCNRKKDGSLYWVDTVISPFVGTSGSVDRFISLRSDITDRMLADMELRRVNTLLRNVLEAAKSMAIIATDVNGKVSLFNRGAENLLGYDSDEVVGQPLSESILDPLDMVACERISSEASGQTLTGFDALVYNAKANGLEEREVRLVNKAGAAFDAHLILSAIKDDKGSVTGYLGLATDITSRREHERAITSARDQLNTAAKVADLGVWTWTLADNALHWNDRMLQMYGYPADLTDLQYEHWYNRVHPEDVEAANALLQQAVAGEAEFNPIFRIVLPSGEIRFIQAAAHVERTQSGDAVKVTGINFDITQRHDFEESLHTAMAQAEAANEAKSAFISNMSHEIRTPMNAVLGMLQLMQQTALNERQQDYVVKAQRAAKSLLHLLNDVLDFSKLDAKKMSLDLHPFELEGFLRDLAGVLTGSTAKYDVELIFDIDHRLPSVLIGDSMRLQQILVNLAGNALKFTPHGQVIVRVQRLDLGEGDGDGNGPATLRFAVEDTGIGISSEQKSKIFSSFEQAESSTSRRYGGTGLGLFICRELVTLMDGEIHLESEEGKGSHFWFDLKLAVEKETPLIEAVSPEFKNKRVLIVEDNKLTSDILAHSLATTGWTIDQVYDGQAAVNQVYRMMQEGINYDVVLMDWRMPQMSGTEAAKAIREMHHAPPMVVMVTAFGQESTAHGEEVELFNNFLLKPVTPRQVIDSVIRALSDEPVVPQLVKSKELRLAGVRLLLVEDNALNRQVAQEMLQQAGAQINIATDGQEAVNMILRIGNQFDLVLMDVQMPRMDGYAATRAIRADSRFASLPILAMTANASAQDRQKCLDSGMTDHIAKPIDRNALVARILALLGKKAKPDDSGASTKDALAAVLERFNGDASLYGRMLGRYSEEAAKQLDLFTTAAKTDDMSGAVRAIHSLKGISGTLGADSVAQLCGDCEAALESGQLSLADALNNGLVENVSREVNATHAHLVVLLNKHTCSANVNPEGEQWQASEWQTRCDMLLEFLNNNDLKAIPLAVDVAKHAPDNIQAAATELVALVEDMDFEVAVQQLKSLQQEAAWKQA